MVFSSIHKWKFIYNYNERFLRGIYDSVREKKGKNTTNISYVS